MKTVLKYPRLHHKFLDSLEYAQIEEYKDHIREDIKDQMKKRGSVGPLPRAPGRLGSPAPSETYSTAPEVL